MPTVQDAIQLIKQGQKAQARPILEAAIRAAPQDLTAWFWYAETLESVEKKVRLLEMCLKQNPGNPQVLKALNVMKARLVPPEPSKPAFDPEPAAPTATPAFALDESAASQEAEPASQAAFSGSIDWDALERQQAEQNAQRMALSSPAAAFSSEESPALPKAESAAPAVKKTAPTGNRMPFWEVWLTVLTVQNPAGFSAALDDPEAGQGRAYEWMAYAGAISGLAVPLALMVSPDMQTLMQMPEMQQVAGQFNPNLFLIIIALVASLFSALSSVIGLMITGGVQHLIARYFGGTGTFSSTVYAIGSYLAPLTMVSTLFSFIPILNCIASLLGFYSILLNVRALQAAQRISAGNAVLVIIIPSLVMFACLCVVGLVAAGQLGPLLEQQMLDAGQFAP